MFTEDSASFVRLFFAKVYELFTSFTIPGTTITPFHLLLGIVATVVIIRLAYSFVGFGPGVVETSKALGRGFRSTSNEKTSGGSSSYDDRRYTN